MFKTALDGYLETDSLVNIARTFSAENGTWYDTVLVICSPVLFELSVTGRCLVALITRSSCRKVNHFVTTLGLFGEWLHLLGIVVM